MPNSRASVDREPHILSAASNLLGISLLVVTGLKISHTASKTFADEISTVAALMFMSSCMLAYLSIRSAAAVNKSGVWADRIFLVGQFTLFVAIIVLIIGGVE
jgi:hypothetical protein